MLLLGQHQTKKNQQHVPLQVVGVDVYSKESEADDLEEQYLLHCLNSEAEIILQKFYLIYKALRGTQFFYLEIPEPGTNLALLIENFPQDHEESKRYQLKDVVIALPHRPQRQLDQGKTERSPCQYGLMNRVHQGSQSD